MSDQPPLASPSGGSPAFEPYSAPAYGEEPRGEEAGARPVADEGGTGGPGIDLTKDRATEQPVTQVAPMVSPSATPGVHTHGDAHGAGPVPPASAPPPPPAGVGAPFGQGAPGGAPWSPYPVSPQGSPYQMAPQYLGHLGAPTHPLATTSLVLGLIGLVSLVLTPFLLLTFIGVVCSPFAIWLGARARREIRTHPQSYSGDGIAMGGFVTGIIGVVLGILGLLAILAVVAFLAAIFSSSS